MKKIGLTMLVGILSFNIQAQNNTNTQTEVITTVRTVKDSDGEKKLVQSEVVKEEQKVQVGEERPNTKNIPIENTPVEVTSTTVIDNNGVQRVVDVDHSHYYMLDGVKYQIKSDNNGGYSMFTSQNQPSGIMKKTSNNNYIFQNKNKYAVGYFDADGNFILESYNSSSDKVTTEKYILQK